MPTTDRAALETVGALGDAAPDVLVVRAREAARDAKATWRTILEDAPHLSWAAPVLIDERGEEHYPTGDVTVRFERPPSDSELKSFSDAHGLHLRRRNEFVAEQASFSPVDARATYLPELVGALQRASGVLLAWANTVSRYHRL